MMWCNKHKVGYLGILNDDCSHCRAEKQSASVVVGRSCDKCKYMEYCKRTYGHLPAGGCTDFEALQAVIEEIQGFGP